MKDVNLPLDPKLVLNINWHFVIVITQGTALLLLSNCVLDKRMLHFAVSIAHTKRRFDLHLEH